MKEFDKPSGSAPGRIGHGKLGNRKARSVRKGIRRKKLQVGRKGKTRRPKVQDARGLKYQGRTRGKHLKSTRSHFFRGA